MKIAIISDLHSNIFAFEKVLHDIKIEKVDKILVVGDIIGYYYWPKEIIDILINDEKFICLKGNHEINLMKVKNNFNKYNDIFKKKYGSGYEICLNVLNKTELDWLFSLPNSLSLTFDNLDFYLTHGILDDIEGYLYPDSNTANIMKNYSDKKYTIFAHTHYPFVHNQNNKSIINPGSIGQPRDVSAMASYVILDTNNSVIRFKRQKFETKLIINEINKRDPELTYLQNVLRR